MASASTPAARLVSFFIVYSRDFIGGIVENTADKGY
jgi:hypothetical protein